jgi:hypothetical protein
MLDDSHVPWAKAGPQMRQIIVEDDSSKDISVQPGGAAFAAGFVPGSPG